MPPIKSDQSAPHRDAQRPVEAIEAARKATLTIRKTKSMIGKARFGPALRLAMEVMANEGLTLPLAAERAGMHIDSVKRAFRRNHVKQAYNQLVADIRANAGQAAYLRINHLGLTADSETVKLEANKWIAGVDNIAPIKRVEGRVQISHRFAGFTFDGDEAMEGQATDNASDGDDD